MFKEHNIPLNLYSRLKQSLNHHHSKDLEDTHNFLQTLPHKLKLELSAYIYQSTYENLYFLQDKSNSFVAWICPLFRPQVIIDDQYLYFEGDDIGNIYFLQKGLCKFVLPKHDNAKFLTIQHGHEFGVLDVIGSIFINPEIEMENWFNRKDKLMRQFTAMSDCSEGVTELLILTLQDLYRIQVEFQEYFETLMNTEEKILQRLLKIKLESIKEF